MLRRARNPSRSPVALSRRLRRCFLPPLRFCTRSAARRQPLPMVSVAAASRCYAAWRRCAAVRLRRLALPQGCSRAGSATAAARPEPLRGPDDAVAGGVCLRCQRSSMLSISHYPRIRCVAIAQLADEQSKLAKHATSRNASGLQRLAKCRRRAWPSLCALVAI